MLTLHESLRRLLCRLGFVVLCLTPTAGVLAWCVVRHSPLYVSQCQRRLSELTTLRVALAGASQPQPNLDVYQGLELFDPETDALLLRSRRVEACGNGTVYLISLTEPETTQAALARLAEVVERQVRHSPSAAERELRLTGCKLTLRGDGLQADEPQIEVVEGSLTAGPVGQTAVLRFRWLGNESAEPATLRLERRSDDPRPVTHIELDTADGDLPCGLLASCCDAIGLLGPGCTFRGHVWIEVAENDRKLEIAGRFSRLDFDTLVTRRFPHVLTGHATLELQQARIEQGKLIEALGRLDAGPGTIGPSLLRAAVGALGSRGNLLRPPQEIVAYKQLALRFELRAGAFELRGDCRSGRRGALVVDEEDQTLMGKPQHPGLSSLALVRLLAPDSDLQVPATRETAALLNWLPLPTAAEREQ